MNFPPCILFWTFFPYLQVIIVGRTESTLKESAKEIGATAYYVLDTGDVPAIEPFVKKVISEHPEVDCLVGLNLKDI